jgi:hypothetical protein
MLKIEDLCLESTTQVSASRQFVKPNKTGAVPKVVYRAVDRDSKTGSAIFAEGKTGWYDDRRPSSHQDSA